MNTDCALPYRLASILLIDQPTPWHLARNTLVDEGWADQEVRNVARAMRDQGIITNQSTEQGPVMIPTWKMVPGDLHGPSILLAARWDKKVIDCTRFLSENTLSLVASTTPSRTVVAWLPGFHEEVSRGSAGVPYALLARIRANAHANIGSDDPGKLAMALTESLDMCVAWSAVAGGYITDQEGFRYDPRRGFYGPGKDVWHRRQS